jgi:hypothetical protein
MQASRGRNKWWGDAASCRSEAALRHQGTQPLGSAPRDPMQETKASIEDRSYTII